MQIYKKLGYAVIAIMALGHSAFAETRLNLSDVLPDGNFQVENAYHNPSRWSMPSAHQSNKH